MRPTRNNRFFKISMQNKTDNSFSLLAIFAHPDDESLVMGGTLARYAREGVEISLICATRGEWGSISDPALATRENLAEAREREMLDACRVLGVRWLHFLDCPDGGINHTYWPPIEEQIVRHIRERRPDIIVTFGHDGLYGHPDHIAVSYLTTAAFTSAGEAACFTKHFERDLPPHQAGKLYYAQFPQNLMRDMLEAMSAEHESAQLWGFSSELFGVPEETITTVIDVSHDVQTKLEALRCHRTQLSHDNAFNLISADVARRFLSKEYFRLVKSYVPAPDDERDLFAGLPAVALSGK